MNQAGRESSTFIKHKGIWAILFISPLPLLVADDTLLESPVFDTRGFWLNLGVSMG